MANFFYWSSLRICLQIYVKFFEIFVNLNFLFSDAQIGSYFTPEM